MLLRLQMTSQRFTKQVLYTLFICICFHELTLQGLLSSQTTLLHVLLSDYHSCALSQCSSVVIMVKLRLGAAAVAVAYFHLSSRSCYRHTGHSV